VTISPSNATLDEFQRFPLLFLANLELASRFSPLVRRILDFGGRLKVKPLRRKIEQVKTGTVKRVKASTEFIAIVRCSPKVTCAHRILLGKIQVDQFGQIERISTTARRVQAFRQIPGDGVLALASDSLARIAATQLIQSVLTDRKSRQSQPIMPLSHENQSPSLNSRDLILCPVGDGSFRTSISSRVKHHNLP